MIRPLTIPVRRRGVAAAELAILLPFLALLFVGAVDFCRVYYYSQTIQECAHSGALYAAGVAKRNTQSFSAETAAKQAAIAAAVSLSPALTESDVEVETEEGVARVTVTYRVSMFTSYPGLPRSLTLKRSVRVSVAPRAPGEQ